MEAVFWKGWGDEESVDFGGLVGIWARCGDDSFWGKWVGYVGGSGREERLLGILVTGLWIATAFLLGSFDISYLLSFPSKLLW